MRPARTEAGGPAPERLHRRVASPVGVLTLIAAGDDLAAILWEDDRPGRVRLGGARPGGVPPVGVRPGDGHPTLIETERQLRQYFAGERRCFDLPLAFDGTAFQVEVWRALLSIPYGETRSYRDIAVQVGRPSATRAVGAANGCNPISIVAPCHRVVGSSGALTGFAGGLRTKAALLALEGSEGRDLFSAGGQDRGWSG